MKKQLESLSTAQLDTTTGGYGFRGYGYSYGYGGGWGGPNPYRAERYLENHARYEQRWASNHPYAAARLGLGGF